MINVAEVNAVKDTKVFKQLYSFFSAKLKAEGTLDNIRISTAVEKAFHGSIFFKDIYKLLTEKGLTKEDAVKTAYMALWSIRDYTYDSTWAIVWPSVRGKIIGEDLIFQAFAYTKTVLVKIKE
jgi:hypothetical protein